MDNKKMPYDHRAHTKKKRRRRLKRSVRRALVLMCAVVVLLGMATGITTLIQNLSPPVTQPPGNGGQPPGSSQTGGGQAGSSVSGLPADTGISKESWDFIGPVPQNVAGMSLAAPDYRMIALPSNGRVDMSYFDDVTFIGDSITQGLEYYKTIPNASYCAYKGIGPKQIYDGSVQEHFNGDQDVPMDFLRASAPKRVYVLMGTNTMVTYNDDDLMVYYETMLDELIKALPGVYIYVQSVTPVIPGVDSRMSNERISALNDRIAKLAWEKGLYFVNLQEALADENGGLRTEYGAVRDGYHMTGEGTRAWLEYLITHTAYHPDNPYLEGSGYYRQLLPEAQA